MQGLGCRVQGPGFDVEGVVHGRVRGRGHHGLGFRVQVSGSRFQGPGSRVWGSGFGVRGQVLERGRSIQTVTHHKAPARSYASQQSALPSEKEAT